MHAPPCPRCPACGCQHLCYPGCSQPRPFSVTHSVVTVLSLSPPMSGFSCGWPEQGMPTCLPQHCKAALGEACPKPGQAAEGSKAEPLRVDVPSSPFRTCSHYRLANTHPAIGWVFVVLEGLSQALVTHSYTCPAGNWNSGSTPRALFWC